MLVLRLYPAEFKGMLYHLENAVYDQQRVPITQQDVGTLILLEYYRSWNQQRVGNWFARDKKKQYSFRLKLSIARAFHLSLQASVLQVAMEQSFLCKLDEALTNHQNPVQQSDRRAAATNLLY